MKDFVRHKIIQKCNVSTGLATFPNIKQKHMFSTLMPLDHKVIATHAIYASLHG